MNNLGKIMLYLAATVVLGALLAAPLYWGGMWLVDHGVWTQLATTPFRKFFHRGLLIAAIVLLWPLTRWVGVPEVRSLGLYPNSWRGRDWRTGVAAAFLMMCALGVVMWALGIVKLRSTVDAWALGKVAVSAVCVSFVEEWLFRGAILGLLNRAMTARWALIWTSALFSILHFLKPDTQYVPETVTWLSGFDLIPGAFAQFREPQLLLGGFLTLYLVGWILGWARFRTRALSLSIGLHTGWVLGLMSFNKITRRVIKDTLPWFGDNLLVGVGALSVVAFTGWLAWVYVRHVRPIRF